MTELKLTPLSADEIIELSDVLNFPYDPEERLAELLNEALDYSPREIAEEIRDAEIGYRRLLMACVEGQLRNEVTQKTQNLDNNLDKSR